MQKIKYFKKGFSNVIWMIVFAVIALGVLGIANTYMADVIQDVHDDQTSNSYSYNVSRESLEAQENIGEKQGTLSNVTMAGAIIMILMAAFGSVALYTRSKR